MAVVVDSSIFIAAERGQFDWIGFHTQLGAEPLLLSVITLAELLYGARRADTVERRSKRLAFIADIEARYPLVPFGPKRPRSTRESGLNSPCTAR